MFLKLIQILTAHSSTIFVYNLYNFYTLVDPDTANTILLGKVNRMVKKEERKMVGKSIVILTFISNKSMNGTGFKAEVKTSKLNCINNSILSLFRYNVNQILYFAIECGGQLRGPSGIIDVFISVDILRYELCVWNITVRPGRTISVKIVDLQMKLQDVCLESYVLVIFCKH